MSTGPDFDPPAPTHQWDCEVCGSLVERYRGQGDVSCRTCGAEYNAFGQRLRTNWRNNRSNYDDEVGDLEGYEMSYGDKYF